MKIAGRCGSLLSLAVERPGVPSVVLQNNIGGGDGGGNDGGGDDCGGDGGGSDGDEYNT